MSELCQIQTGKDAHRGAEASQEISVERAEFPTGRNQVSAGAQ